jgi:hypothetical protein
MTFLILGFVARSIRWGPNTISILQRFTDLDSISHQVSS